MPTEFTNDLKWEYSFTELPNPTEKKIESFRMLQPGWRYGEGVRIEDDVIADTIELNKTAFNMGFINTVATPIENGGISLLIFYGGFDMEFVIEPQRTIFYYLSQDENEVEEQHNLTQDQATAKIHEFWNRQCVQSDYSNWGNTSHRREDSTVQRHSRIQEMVQASPYWTASV